MIQGLAPGAARSRARAGPGLPLYRVLGIFPGRLRYTDAKPSRAIGAPIANLWLDYSEVMGKLNKIKVAKGGEIANVCLAWEGVNEIRVTSRAANISESSS